MRETWKDIKDFEGIYQISTLGRVKRNMVEEVLVALCGNM